MPSLVGIARMAAESPQLEAKRRVEYLELPARSYLARVDAERMPFAWGINPYRGCEFGCKYCYARYTHEFMELREPAEFERKIFAKEFDAARFLDELRKLPKGESVAIGTATDPYQPAERRYGVTRRMLEAFIRVSGLKVGIISKSDLIVRDIDLFKKLSRSNYLSIAMTITTLDTELARLLEPLAPRPDLRLAALGELNQAGLRTTVSCSPVLPLINDSEESLDRVARAAAEAGASRVFANVLFLKPCAQAVFFPFLEREFPTLVRRYRERYEQSAYLRGAYPEIIRERMDRIRKRHGLDRHDAAPEPELWPRDSQLDLFT